MIAVIIPGVEAWRHINRVKGPASLRPSDPPTCTVMSTPTYTEQQALEILRSFGAAMDSTNEAQTMLAWAEVGF